MTTINTSMFILGKNKHKKEGDKSPDYRLSTKVGDNFEEIGAAWVKVSEKNQSKYLSVKLAEGLNVTGTVVPYEKKTSSVPTSQSMEF